MTTPPFTTIEQAFALAKRRLPPSIYRKMVNQGLDGRDLAIRENERVFDDLLFEPRACAVHPRRDLTTTVLGRPVDLPVLLSAPGGSRIYHPAGEPAVAAAAGAAGTVNVMSMSHGHTIEEVRAAAPDARLWQQVYLSLGREAAEELIGRARGVGCEALMLTVDFLALPEAHQADVARMTRQNVRRYGVEAVRRPRWLAGYLRDAYAQRTIPEVELRPTAGGGSAARLRTGLPGPGTQISPTWADFDWINEAWDGPLVIKGILSADDAKRALDVGADAIVVSNHGGVGLSSVPSSLSRLGTVLDAVDGRAEVYLDSGVRRGSDVVKALALGARAALIGRPYMMGLAVAGQAGVEQVLSIFRREIDMVLANIGCPSVAELDGSYLVVPDGWRGRG